MTPSRALRGLLCASALAVAGIGAAPAGSYADGSAVPGSATGAVFADLSNLHTSSEWAYPLSAAPARSAPSVHARIVGRLVFLTSDDQAELYLALASATLPSGQTWVRVELPGRPNGKTGWVPRAALGALHVVRSYLLVNRSTLRATLFHDGRPILRVPVGVGKASTPTPPGHFYVLEKLTSLGDPFYGPYALGTSAYAPTLSEWPGGGVVGIHGTDAPQLIPGRPSHGCVRLRNADITRLWHLVALGTPITIE